MNSNSPRGSAWGCRSSKAAISLSLPDDHATHAWNSTLFSIHLWIDVLKDLLGPQMDAEEMPITTEWKLLLKKCFSDQL